MKVTMLLLPWRFARPWTSEIHFLMLVRRSYSCHFENRP